jgi:adenylate cyclase
MTTSLRAGGTTRRLAAIVVVDVVGYSRLMAEDEAGTLATMTAHFAEIDPVLLNHGGRVVKRTGDGLLIEVPSAVEAIGAAVEAQRLMRERNASLPEERRMQLRIGINLGDVIVDETGDIFGDGVNVAARLEGLADPGGICVSASVHDQVRGRIAVDLESLGPVEVKNIPRPIEAWRVRLGGEASSRISLLPSRDLPTIAVLPFANLSADPDESYFSDGIVEDLITALSHSRELRVVARSSSFAMRDRNLDIRDAARELDATYIVNGSVRRAGNRVRVSSQLIEAETGHHVWADRFDRDLDDIFAVQDEIVGDIAGHIRPHMAR